MTFVNFVIDFGGILSVLCIRALDQLLLDVFSLLDESSNVGLRPAGDDWLCRNLRMQEAQTSIILDGSHLIYKLIILSTTSAQLSSARPSPVNREMLFLHGARHLFVTVP